jgi:hypothetical protein
MESAVNVEVAFKMLDKYDAGKISMLGYETKSRFYKIRNTS